MAPPRDRAAPELSTMATAWRASAESSSSAGAIRTTACRHLGPCDTGSSGPQGSTAEGRPTFPAVLALHQQVDGRPPVHPTPCDTTAASRTPADQQMVARTKLWET